MYDERVLNRVVPDQAWQLSNPSGTAGVLLYSIPNACFITSWLAGGGIPIRARVR